MRWDLWRPGWRIIGMNAWAIPATQPTAVVVNIRGKKISHSYTACKDFLWRGGGVSLVCKGWFCKYVRIRLTGPLLSVWLLWPRQCGLHCGHFGLHQPQRAPAGNLSVSPLPSSRVESPGVQCFVNEEKTCKFP